MIQFQRSTSVSSLLLQLYPKAKFCVTGRINLTALRDQRGLLGPVRHHHNTPKPSLSKALQYYLYLSCIHLQDIQRIAFAIAYECDSHSPNSLSVGFINVARIGIQ